MRTLGYFDGAHGTICIIEDKATGARRYYEGNAFQSHALPSGESCFTYVHLMNNFLRQATNVLLLGCAGGTLATMLHRQGKAVTLVDHNPLSFKLARDYFWMPGDIRCVVADFRDFLDETTDRFDGIAIDVGGPEFRFEHEFDRLTCQTLRRMRTQSGRIAMNILVDHDLDPLPDQITADLAGADLNAWIIDEAVGEPERNAIIACAPERRLELERETLPPVIAADFLSWSVRRPRLR
jgi:SAM-dependent methyltransferase